MADTIFKDKTLLITGGTGCFGNTVLKHFLTTDIGEIRIFSRDEKKQDDMRHELQAKYPELRRARSSSTSAMCAIPQSVRDAMPGVDYIFHAAALKQVPSCEFFPMEAVRTNIDRHRQRAARGHRRGRRARRLPVHRQGGLPHQRHGHLQGHDGARHLSPTPAWPRSAAARSSAAPATATSCAAAAAVIPLFVDQITCRQPHHHHRPST